MSDQPRDDKLRDRHLEAWRNQADQLQLLKPRLEQHERQLVQLRLDALEHRLAWVVSIAIAGWVTAIAMTGLALWAILSHPGV